MKPLCQQGAYGPFIRTGQTNFRHKAQAGLTGTDAYQLVIVEDGVVPYRHRGKTFSPPTPYGLLIPPGADTEVFLFKGATWHYLRFDAVYQPRPPRRQPLAEEVWGVALPLEIPRECLDQCRARVRWCNTHWWRDAINYARANHQLGLWLLDLVDTISHGAPRRIGWLDHLRHHCTENIVHGLTVADLARHAGMSRQNLRHKLMATCQMTPKAFLDSIRLDAACHRLRSTLDPITKVSKLCGYSSVTLFTRRFKKYTGHAPRRWRQENR